MDKEEAFYWAIDRRIARLYRLYVLYDRITGRLQEEYGWKNKDIRLSFFNEMAQALYHLTLFCRLARGGSLNEKWMNESMPEEREYDTETLKHIFNGSLAQLNISYWHIFYSLTHDKFQQLNKKIFQKKGEVQQSLPKLAEQVLEQTGAPFPATLFQLFHNVHHCLKGNQFYNDGYRKYSSLEYRDKTYEFTGGRLKFDTFTLLLHIVEDLAGIYVNIVRSDDVQSWNFTWDPHFRTG